MLTAKSEGERQAIETQFALNRQAALTRYQGQLQSLYNSSGWQGVFGNVFAAGSIATSNCCGSGARRVSRA